MASLEDLLRQRVGGAPSNEEIFGNIQRGQDMISRGLTQFPGYNEWDLLPNEQLRRMDPGQFEHRGPVLDPADRGRVPFIPNYLGVEGDYEMSAQRRMPEFATDEGLFMPPEAYGNPAHRSNMPNWDQYRGTSGPGEFFGNIGEGMRNFNRAWDPGAWNTQNGTPNDTFGTRWPGPGETFSPFERAAPVSQETLVGRDFDAPHGGYRTTLDMLRGTYPSDRGNVPSYVRTASDDNFGGLGTIGDERVPSFTRPASDDSFGGLGRIGGADRPSLDTFASRFDSGMRPWAPIVGEHDQGPERYWEPSQVFDPFANQPWARRTGDLRSPTGAMNFEDLDIPGQGFFPSFGVRSGAQWNGPMGDFPAVETRTAEIPFMERFTGTMDPSRFQPMTSHGWEPMRGDSYPGISPETEQWSFYQRPGGQFDDRGIHTLDDSYRDLGGRSSGYVNMLGPSALLRDAVERNSRAIDSTIEQQRNMTPSGWNRTGVGTLEPQQSRIGSGANWQTSISSPGFIIAQPMNTPWL